MRGERSNHTLQPTALVHEAYVKLVDQAQERNGEVRWDSHEQFLRMAAQAMRFVLVDHARARECKKRAPEGERVLLEDALQIYEERAIDILALDAALEELSGVDAQLARIVELRFFAGLNTAETAQALEVSTRTVERGWWTARAWLRHSMQGDEQVG